MTVHRTDFKQVRPTVDEIADHVDRYGRRPAVDRAECVRCGTRIWYSGLAIGSHTRACSGERTAPAKVVDFYRSLPGAYGAYANDDKLAERVFVVQAFRSGDGWIDVTSFPSARPFFATKSNLELLRRRGFTAVAFDLLGSSETVPWRDHVVADFQLAEVA